MTIGQGQEMLPDQKPNRSRPEGPLPGAFFRKLHAQTSHCGHLKLAVAVLEDAVHSLERNQGSREFIPLLIHWEAEQWIASRDRDWLFSFENICSMLCLDSERIRAEIFRWRQQKRHQAVGTASSASAEESPAARRQGAA